MQKTANLLVADRFVSEIKRRLPIEQYIEQDCGLRLYSMGNNRYKRACPFHNEKQPSFMVYGDTQSYFCFGCIQADELVWTAEGLKQIKSVRAGDRVLDVYGHWSNVLATEYKKGSLLKVKLASFGEGLSMTPDHTCIFLTREQVLTLPYITERKGDSGKRIVRYSTSKRKSNSACHIRFSEGQAQTLRVGDFFAYPVIPEQKRSDSNLIKTGLTKSDTEEPHVKRIECLPATEQAARLYGYYLSGGSCAGETVRFTFSLNGKETYVKEVQEILLSVFDLKSTFFVDQKRSICEVICCSVDLVAQFSHWFGKGCTIKKVPPQLLNWRVSLQKELIESYTKGCGNGVFGSVTSASMELSYGIYALLVQTGQIPSLSYKTAHVGKDGTPHKEYWTVSKRNRQSSSVFFEVINGTTYLLSEITEITCDEKEADVVDIAVEGSESFVTKSAVVHNCKAAGNVVKFAQQFHSWSWQQTLEHFAERFGISTVVKDSEMAELIFESYIRRCCGRADDLNAIGVNFHVSRECKKIFRSFPDSLRIQKWTESIYRATDTITVTEDRSSLYRLRYQVLPMVEQFAEEAHEKDEVVRHLCMENKLCYSCCHRYSTPSVEVGTGNTISPIMFVAAFPQEHVFDQVKEQIHARGFVENNFWFDYVLSCHVSSDPASEFKCCKSRWLDKRVEIIKPKIIVSIGEKTFTYLTGRSTYKDWHRLNENTEIWAFRSVMDDAEKRRLRDLIDKYADK